MIGPFEVFPVIRSGHIAFGFLPGRCAWKNPVKTNLLINSPGSKRVLFVGLKTQCNTKTVDPTRRRSPCQLMQRLLTLISVAVPAAVDKRRHGVNRVHVQGVPGVMGKGAEHGFIHGHFPLKKERTGVRILLSVSIITAFLSSYFI